MPPSSLVWTVHQQTLLTNQASITISVFINTNACTYIRIGEIIYVSTLIILSAISVD